MKIRENFRTESYSKALKWENIKDSEQIMTAKLTNEKNKKIFGTESVNKEDKMWKSKNNLEEKVTVKLKKRGNLKKFRIECECKEDKIWKIAKYSEHKMAAKR